MVQPTSRRVHKVGQALYRESGYPTQKSTHRHSEWLGVSPHSLETPLHHTKDLVICRREHHHAIVLSFVGLRKQYNENATLRPSGLAPFLTVISMHLVLVIWESKQRQLCSTATTLLQPLLGLDRPASYYSGNINRFGKL